MSSIKMRLSQARSKLLRRQSGTSSAASSAGSERQLTSSSLSRLPELSATGAEDHAEAAEQRLVQSEVLATAGSASTRRPRRPSRPEPGSLPSQHGASTPIDDAPSNYHRAHVHVHAPDRDRDRDAGPACPTVTIEEPTPVQPPFQTQPVTTAIDAEPPSELSSRASAKPTPPDFVRRQSLVAPSNARAIKTLLQPDLAAAAAAAQGPPTETTDYFAGAATFNAGMLHRKIWVKRQNASATLVQIREDDLVDDVREMILKKYGNSLGRTFDAPDLTLRIVPRDPSAKSHERMLGPEEDMCRTLDAYFPGGQAVTEALIIDITKPRTPRPSPRVPAYYTHHEEGPHHQQTEYFPLMPISNPSPAIAAASHDPRNSLAHPTHSIAVLQTGQLPPLPSPGGGRRGHNPNRPKYPRHNTASPITLTGGPPLSATSSRPPQRHRQDSSASDTKHSTSSNTNIPTPPIPIDPNVPQNSTPPAPRISSPRPEKKRKKVKSIEPPSLPAGLLDNSVPPINVLIVEDNIINLRVLGAFMQRLKVRWQRAMNGKEAVEKWRAGGFHLVLMDIQLPIMDGLEATREIRRLERVNSIGVFSSGSSEAPNTRLGGGGTSDRDLKEDDKLGEKGLFKSPVIIVALTASSLQSDRHEALAAGCNDFLTKPVNFVWLERKVKEWGCMQALIDFDGWRRWKDFANDSDTTAGTSKLSTSYSSIAPRKGKAAASPTLAAMTPNGQAGPSGTNGTATSTEDKKLKRRSMGVVPPPALPEEESNASTPDVDVDSGDN